MNVVEKSGKTLEDAIEAAVAELGGERENIDYEIIEVPSKGLFGLIGGKPARVKAWLKTPLNTEDRPVVNEGPVIKESPVRNDQPEDRPKVDPVQVAREFLTHVFQAMDMDVKIEKLSDTEHITLNLRGNDLGILIGKHGQTLDALQYLTNLAAHRDSDERTRIVLDIEDYRKRRAETLSRLAHRLADRVKAGGEKVVLEPMSPHERKVIHMTLQDDSRVMTYSEGEEPYRKVIIALKK